MLLAEKCQQHTLRLSHRPMTELQRFAFGKPKMRTTLMSHRPMLPRHAPMLQVASLWRLFYAVFTWRSFAFYLSFCSLLIFRVPQLWHNSGLDWQAWAKANKYNKYIYRKIEMCWRRAESFWCFDSYFFFSHHIFGMQLVFVFAQPAKVDNEQVLKCDQV